MLTAPDGRPLAVDSLRLQRLAAPVIVYVEAFSAHPLEADAAHLYALPDGWVDGEGTFSAEQPAAGGVPVYVVELRPEDGLLPLPYMARQANGSAWEDATSSPGAAATQTRQTFYPDASRIYEEIDRVGIDRNGRPVGLSQLAAFDFYRAAPSGGWTRGRAAAVRTDVGEGDILPEEAGKDYFGYYPRHLGREPTLAVLARATTMVQRVLSGGDYIGAQWLEGSPNVEETMYWLGLLIDTTVPLVGHAAQRPHGTLSADGDRNLVDGVRYLLSGAALDADGVDRIGPVVIVDEVVFAAREVTKADARPGGYEAVGGHGGIVADMGGEGAPQVTFVPARKHTHTSEVRMTSLPAKVVGVAGSLGDGVRAVDVPVKDGKGGLPDSAMPRVTFTRYGRYTSTETGPADNPDVTDEVEILARIEANLAGAPLAGFVAEGKAPFGGGTPTSDAALQVAVYCGMPVVRVGRGSPGGMVPKQDPLSIAGNNLSATKARILLMACLLKLGALPPAADPYHPTPAEADRTRRALEAYQAIFDTH
ncbi:MAG: asparaginase domain-containing protein [Streptosporangiaceae bacterium]